MKAKKFLSILACIMVLLSFPTLRYIQPIVEVMGTVDDSAFPVIQDFYINSTWSGQLCQWSFCLADAVGLDHAVFGCNVTQNFINDSSTPLSGTQAWANYTHTLPAYDCLVSFQLWFWNNNGSMSTTGRRCMKVYTSTPFISLSQAIQSVDSANNWNTADTYAQTVLAKKTTADLQRMIDNYASASDWTDVLYWSAVCNKLGIAQETDIINALGNYTMVGNLPYTPNSGGIDFSPEQKWALYGYYYAGKYNTSLTKWNITAAYQQFNSSVDYSIQHSHGLPLWIYADGTARTSTNRYYDEDACTIDCYIIFAELLKVSRAMDDALRWWSYTNSVHWNEAEQHYGYTGTTGYECEAPFFLKIISTLKYYYPPLENWTRVLTDIENRFLRLEWNSSQWLDSAPSSTYVVVHMYPGNEQRRLENTFGAWQTLLGVYSQLNSTYQSDVKDMLYGNSATEPAWTLLFRPATQLYNSPSGLFRWRSYQVDDNNATAYAEILLFLLGMVSQSTTVAFPLEELNYEYIQDIDPQLFQFNLTNQTVTIPVSGAGTILFQYGASPVTCSFNQSGIWQVAFSNSWNMITTVTCTSPLPTNRIYLDQTDAPLYNVTIKAHCIAEGADIGVQIALDGSLASYTTPCTFIGLRGSHTLTVADNDTNGDAFKQWNTGQTTTTLNVSSGGTWIAYYGPSPVHDVAVTDIAASRTFVGQNYSLSVNVTVGNPGDYPETFNVTVFANATAIENLTITDLSNGTFTFVAFAWNTSGYPYSNLTISAIAWPVSNEADLSDNTSVGSSVCVTIPGDLNGDFKVTLTDLSILAQAYNTKLGDAKWNANADINGNGKVSLSDFSIMAKYYNQHYP